MGFLKSHGVLSIIVTRVLALVFIVGLAGSLAALCAQEGAGSMRGAVVDESGRTVPNAAIAIRGLGRDAPAAVTNTEGQFTISGLPAGTYSLQASAAGFAVLERQVTVAAGNATEISLSLKLASVSEEVTVEAEADTSLASEMAPMKSLLEYQLAGARGSPHRLATKPGFRANSDHRRDRHAGRDRGAYDLRFEVG